MLQKAPVRSGLTLRRPSLVSLERLRLGKRVVIRLGWLKVVLTLASWEVQFGMRIALGSGRSGMALILQKAYPPRTRIERYRRAVANGPGLSLTWLEGLPEKVSSTSPFSQ